MSTPTEIDAARESNPVARTASAAQRLLAEVEKAVVGKRDVLELVLAGLLADGHVLLDDVPGVAKTLMARSFAAAAGLDFSRVQFTPDVLPADITGATVLDLATNQPAFRPGPIFAQLVLADEVNRAPAKTQAALLEAMQELSVTVRGTTHRLTPPFFVLATQNPIELEGTYPLPEAQLDRFLFNIVLDYLDADEELEVVNRFTTQMDMPEVHACTTAREILEYQKLVRQVPIAESVNRFAVDLVRATRPNDPQAPEVVRRYVQYGASVRATMFITLAAKARALLAGRYHVTREDIAALALPVLRHRVLTNYFAESDSITVDQVLKQLVESFGGRELKARVV